VCVCVCVCGRSYSARLWGLTLCTVKPGDTHCFIFIRSNKRTLIYIKKVNKQTNAYIKKKTKQTKQRVSKKTTLGKKNNNLSTHHQFEQECHRNINET
jgi:hypothetical protein